MSQDPDPQRFYTETIPAQWNRGLEVQQTRGEAGRALFEQMRAVSATIRVEVEGDSGGTFFLNIDGGRMRSEPSAARPPFLTLRQDRRAFERIAREAGDSAMALLGGLSGLAGEMKLTRTRMENLSALKGLVRFEVTGDAGFAIGTHFGTDPVPETPHTTISVDADASRELRSGKLDPQDAFMSGRIQVDGDMQLAMQLAFAAIAPD